MRQFIANPWMDRRVHSLVQILMKIEEKENVTQSSEPSVSSGPGIP
jgi:hypothetical protein